MAAIEKRTSSKGETTYRVKVRLRGFPPQSATFSRLTDARKWGKHTESALIEGRYFKTAEARKHTFAELVDRYIKDVIPSKSPVLGKSQKSQMLWWKGRLGHHILADVTPALIVECRDKLLAETTRRKTLRSPSTVVRYMSALSHAFTVAVNEWGWLDDSPMRKVKKPKEPRGRVRFLSEDELLPDGSTAEGERTRLLEACKASSNPYLYPVVVLALSTGMRQGEIMNLTWDDVELKKGRITLHDTKNGETRVAPLAGHAFELLTEHSKVRKLDTRLLFPSKAKKKSNKPHKPMDLRAPWLAAVKAAEIENFKFHDLRHSAASYLAMNGASLAEIAEVLGHKTLQMVKRYAHLSEAHTTGVVASMNEKIFGGQK